MKCTILHESRGRLRVHVCNVRMTLHRADVLEAYLNHHDAVSKAKVYERTGDVVVCYTGSRKAHWIVKRNPVIPKDAIVLISSL